MERLQKVISNSGYCSRRKAEEYILAGKVRVNGILITQMGEKVNPSDIIEVDGNTIENKDIIKRYYLLNKPRGYISSSSDEKNRKCVVELIDTDVRIYPVGRLDYDTTGLLLLTNDGDLTNYLTHPSNEIPKTYLAKLEGLLDKDDIAKLKKGIKVDGRKVKIVDFKIKKRDLKKATTYISITIVEGRNHIVKNLFHELGYEVIKLTRTNYGFLDLGNLQSGEYRELSIKEVKKLFSK